ncbi:MAG: hypothetical protein COV66_08495 [Nitrospinae bacterium CG11_big_fil_rev_8_21_14_0_20_45_15]|nr:MAG: hypothetical protein COV66_08495 [Nitrospinae bacterium CG11_big_fil_rev_8_21_14_0_20_45_15]
MEWAFSCFREFKNNIVVKKKEKRMNSKNVHIKNMREQLENWETEIDQLKEKTGQVNAETQVKYYKQIEDLRLLQKEARQKLSELSNAGDEGWESLKQDVGSAYENIKTTLTKTQKAFKEGLNENKEK